MFNATALTPAGGMVDADALTCGQHSANTWSGAADNRPDGLHARPDLLMPGHRLVRQILDDHLDVVTPAAATVRLDSERAARWWQQLRRAEAAQLSTLFAGSDDDTVRIARVAA